MENEERPSKRAKRPHDPDQRLLGGVVGIAGAAGDPAAHGMDAVVVAAQQAVERDRGRPPARQDELGVVGGHRRQAVNEISPSRPRYGLAVLQPLSRPSSFSQTNT